jgi:hypothetical protein
MDVKAGADAGLELITGVAGLLPSGGNALLLAFALIGSAILFFSGIGRRIRRVVEEMLFSNWQLTLLGGTAIALSLASGYTTFDGLRNFTSAPLLSLLIAFGIQGVMLIVAWLIGESFATGMSQQAGGGRRSAGALFASGAMGLLLGIALIGLVFYWVLSRTEAMTIGTGAGVRTDWTKIADVSAYFGLGLVLLAIMAFNFRRGGDIATPYVQSARIIARNLVLWVMFLATMAASVFFSFDSHFNAIFPKDQRVRAAENRTLNQIGGIVADTGALAQKRQIEEAEALFQSSGWQSYDTQLSSLAQSAQSAQREIEQYYVRLIEERQIAIRAQQERISTAQSGQAGLAGRKTSLVEELARIKAERPGLAAEYAQHKSELDAKAKEVDAKRIEALAEDRGVEGTLKQGRGPIYRQRMSELERLRDEHKIKEERTKDAQKRLTGVESRIAQIERELSTLDGDLAKLKGEAETAETRIKAAQTSASDEGGLKLDPARVLPAFERARAAFRQQPDVERLGGLQQQCGHLLNAMSSTPATKDKVRAIDCDPKQVAEAAARVFALNAGLIAFHQACAGGDRLPQGASTDALLSFGRKCLQDSALTSAEAGAIGGRLQAIEMNRDDKAHPFVVSINAFLDGNRLAYLALILAVGVDALVFMAGLFGANAVRSPLSDVPSSKARNAHQLEAIIANALLPDTFETATAVLEALHPITPENGFTGEVIIPFGETPWKRRVLKVLNAGATIGAVARDPDRPERYLVRSELFEFLSVAAKDAFDADERHGQLAELKKLIVVALQPHVGDNAEVVLQHMHPITEQNGFSAEVNMGQVPAPDQPIVRKTLGAGSVLNYVARDSRAGEDDRYYVHKELYRTIAYVAAEMPRLGLPQLPSRDGRREMYGGVLGGRGAIKGVRHSALAGPKKDLPSAEADHEALISRYVAELVAGIGPGLEAAPQLFDANVREDGNAAWGALQHLGDRNDSLRDYLSALYEERREKVDQIGSRMRQKIQTAAEEDAFKAANARVDAAFDGLLLTPSVGAIEELVDGLERVVGPGNAQSEERDVLDQLRVIARSSVAGYSDKNSGGSERGGGRPV